MKNHISKFILSGVILAMSLFSSTARAADLKPASPSLKSEVAAQAATFEKLTYSRSQELAIRDLRKWYQVNGAVIQARADAKGWHGPMVSQSLARLASPYKDENLAEIVARLKKMGADKQYAPNLLYGKPKLTKLVREAYLDAQVLGFVLSDDTTPGTPKQCNE